MSKGKHAKKTLSAGTGTVVAVAAAGAAAAPGVIFGTAHHAPPVQVHAAGVQLAAAQAPVVVKQQAEARLASVTVSAGDTLSGISGELCGTEADYPNLAAGNGIADPDMIVVGKVVKDTCHAYVPKHAAKAAVSPVTAAPVQQSSVPAAAPAAVTTAAGGYSCGALESLWVQAGGSTGLAPTMAGIAMAESGGNPNAVSPTDDFGLWQDHADPAALSPSVSAAASVTIEQTQGLDAWTTYRTGAYAGQC